MVMYLKNFLVFVIFCFISSHYSIVFSIENNIYHDQQNKEILKKRSFNYKNFGFLLESDQLNYHKTLDRASKILGDNMFDGKNNYNTKEKTTS